MSDNNDKEAVTIVANTNTLKAVMTLKENYHVDFKPHNSISSVLAFSKKNLRVKISRIWEYNQHS